MAEKYINRYNSFRRSLADLEELPEKDLNDKWIISAAVQKFSLTFDLAWKVMKDIIIEDYGIMDFATGSPRDTLRTAYSVNLIDDDVWLEMLKDRNNLTHDYDGMLEKKAVYQIRDVYIPVLIKFKKNVSEHIRKMKLEKQNRI